jgi:hypothetical protein
VLCHTAARAKDTLTPREDEALTLTAVRKELKSIHFGRQQYIDGLIIVARDCWGQLIPGCYCSSDSPLIHNTSRSLLCFPHLGLLTNSLHIRICRKTNCVHFTNHITTPSTLSYDTQPGRKTLLHHLTTWQELRPGLSLHLTLRRL